MRKNIKKIFSKKNNRRKNDRRKTYKRYKKYKGGKIIIKSYQDLEERKNRLVNSFDHLNEIYDKWYNKTHFVTIRGFVEAIVTGIFGITPLYNKFDNFYNKLMEYNIIECDEEKYCINYSITLPGTGRALYKIFKIYFVIAYIIGYVYTNPTKFISEKFLESILIQFPFVNVLIYLLKNPLSGVGCNKAWQLSNYCYVPKSLDKFIEVNELYTHEDVRITTLIFEFVDVVRPWKRYIDIDWLVDPELDPRKGWWGKAEK